MKGMIFQQQIESKLEVFGEEFRQGDLFSGALNVNNRSSSGVPLKSLCLELALGNLRKLKQKAADSFTSIVQAELPADGEIAAGEQKSFPFKFQLDKNAIISDSGQSLCIVYGLADATPLGFLALTVLPHADIEGILGVFETSFQFDPRGQKSKAGAVAAKLKAPSGTRFKSVDELELSFRFEAEKLLLRYLYTVKKLEAGPSTLEIQKKKLDFAQELRREQYFSPAGFVDSKLLEPIIEEALAPVVSKFSL